MSPAEKNLHMIFDPILNGIGHILPFFIPLFG